jgi:opacity protein-like surface antigen
MKTRLIMAGLTAALLTAAGAASAQQMYYRTAQVPGQASADTYTQAQMDQGANPQTQSGDTSYGGTSMMSQSASGMSDSPASKPCTRGPNCNIFFGQ